MGLIETPLQSTAIIMIIRLKEWNFFCRERVGPMINASETDPRYPENSACPDRCAGILIEAGGIDLSAVVHLPDKVPAPVIICSHGLLSSKDSPKFIAIGDEMSGSGFCVLRFDFSGIGQSPPRRFSSLVESRRLDLEAVISFALKQHWSNGRIGLLGSSMGGFVSLLAGDEGRDFIRALVSWAAPFDIGKIHPEPEEMEQFGKMFPDGFSLGVPTDLSSLREAGPALVIHGQLDEIVPWKDSIRIYERLRNPKRLLLMRTADHRIIDDSWRKKAIEASREWFLTYLV
jgi:pimeloyl-ACP methyl ester carboxylesterase